MVVVKSIDVVAALREVLDALYGRFKRISEAAPARTHRAAQYRHQCERERDRKSPSASGRGLD